MLLGFLFAILIAALGMWLLVREGHSLRERDVLLDARTLPRVTVTAIYCLDCAGEDYPPRKTFLTSAGRCHKCFGRAYQLATVWAPGMREILQQRFRARQTRERTREIERRNHA